MYNNYLGLLSKEDYLAVNEEYQNKKEQIRKHYRNLTVIGLVIMAFGIFILPVMLVAIDFDEINSFIIFGVCMIVMTSGIIVAAISSSTGKRKIKELGVMYYQQYLSANRV